MRIREAAIGVRDFARHPGGVVVAVALAALLAACATSAPLRFYTLSAVSSAGAAPAAEGAAAIRVGRVRIPAELDRAEIVQRIDANRVSIAEQDRWAAPLDDMIRRALAADLPGRGVGAAEGSRVLSLEIDEFIGDSTCAVTLRASWELKGAAADSGSVASGQEVINIPSPSSAACTPGALPAPMSQALAELGARILASKQ